MCEYDYVMFKWLTAKYERVNGCDSEQNTKRWNLKVNNNFQLQRIIAVGPHNQSLSLCCVILWTDLVTFEFVFNGNSIFNSTYTFVFKDICVYVKGLSCFCGMLIYLWKIVSTGCDDFLWYVLIPFEACSANFCYLIF